jgi:endoglucanase
VSLPFGGANAESYVSARYQGLAYQRAVQAYVRLLNSNGLVAILDLHWTDGAYNDPSADCSSLRAVCQKPMPDAGQSVAFWSSVARIFRGDDAVIFDLFNEPFPDQPADMSQAQAWQCWRDGGAACHGIGYQVAGMQALVRAIRATGANNVLMLGGLNWASDLTGWLAHLPADPDHNLAVSWHSYNFSDCNTLGCWNSQIAPALRRVPLIAGKIGQSGCADAYIGRLMAWLDARSASYLAWAWNAAGCSSGPSLVTNYAGQPTSYGAGYRSHLRSLG